MDSSILFVLAASFILAQISIFVFFSLKKEIQEKKKKLILFHKALIEKEGLTYKPLSFMTFGLVSFNSYSNRLKINSFYLNKFPLPVLFYLVAREVRRQATYESKGLTRSFAVVSRDKIQNLYMTILLLWGSVISGYVRTLDLDTESMERLGSMAMLPANVIILMSLYQRFLSKKSKNIKIEFNKDLDSYADETVGGGMFFWANKIHKRTPFGEPSFKDRYELSKQHPFKDQWSSFL